MLPSRHSLGLSPAHLAWLPTPLAADRLLALGGFAAEGGAQGGPSHVVELHCFAAGDGAPSLRRLRRWLQPEDACALAAAPLAAGELLLLAASTGGALTQVRVKLPSDGEAAEALEFLDDDGSGALAPLCALGGLAEVALDAAPGGSLAVAATSGGILALLPLDAPSCTPARLAADGDACFSAVRCASRTTLLTAGGAPGLQVWDTRAEGAAQALAWSPPGASGRAGTLDVLPAAPHLVAAGSADLGAPAVALFDLRHTAAPLACGVPAGSGPVTSVLFDTSGEFTDRGGSWLLAAAGGCVSAVAADGPSREVLRCDTHVRHCALESGAALLAVATEGEAVLVLDGLRGRRDDGM